MGELSGTLTLPDSSNADGIKVRIWLDPDSATDPNEIVFLDSTETDANGNYTFQDLKEGTYSLVAIKIDGQDTLVAYEYGIIIVTSSIEDNETVVNPMTLEIDPAGRPPVPTGLSAAYDTSTGIVSLNWSAVEVSDLVGYLIYRELPNSVDIILISDFLVTELVFNDTIESLFEANDSLKLVYRITSRDEDGNVSDYGLFDTVTVSKPANEIPILTTQISGRVVDKNGEPLAGVSITTDPVGINAQSRSDGYFLLPDLEPGTYHIKLSARDYLDTSFANVTVGIVDSLDMGDFAMTYRYATIRGRVEDITGKPIIGAGIEVEGQNISSFTFTGGEFILTRVEPGQVRLLAAGEGFTGFLALDVQADDEITGVNMVTEIEGGIIVGRLLTSDSVSIPSATISAVGGVISDKTDAEGHFILYGVPKGSNFFLHISGQDIDDMLLGIVTNVENEVTDAGIIIWRPPVVNNGITLFATDILGAPEQEFLSLAGSSNAAGPQEIANFQWNRDNDGNFDTTTHSFYLQMPLRIEGESYVGVRAVDTEGTYSGTAYVKIIMRPPTDIPQVFVELFFLTLSNGILTPPFDSNENNYSILDYTRDTISIHPGPNPVNADISVNGTPVMDKNKPTLINLTENVSTIPILVTLENVDSNLYTLTVFKDTTPPVIEFVSPLQDTVINSTAEPALLNIECLAKDANFVTEITMEVTGAVTLPAQTITPEYAGGVWPGETPFELQMIFVEGVSQVMFTVTDAAGNQSADTLNVTVLP